MLVFKFSTKFLTKVENTYKIIVLMKLCQTESPSEKHLNVTFISYMC